MEVTAVRPTPEGKGLPELGVNLFLYQVTRNNKRSSNKGGGKSKRTSIGVDLHYVLTFHGDEKLLAAHKLVAKVMGILGDHPRLTSDMITSAIAESTDEELADSDLADQPEEINIIQLALETDELAKICPMVVQPPYAPYLAYQITVVMIEGAEPGELRLRVRDRRVYVAPDRPTISWVMPQTGIKQPILADSTLLIRGKRLKHEQTRVQLGSHRLVPQEVTETEVSLSLKEVDASLLSSGVNSLQIVHLIATDKQPEPDHILQSNALPFVLCPEIVGEVNVSQL